MQYEQTKIAQRIRQERNALRWSQQRLAEELHVERNTVGIWERLDTKGRIPPLRDLLEMCRHFQCELGYLLCEFDCKTRVTADIQAKTGLSKKAIEILVEQHSVEGGIFINCLSQMIEFGEFRDLVRGLAEWNNRTHPKSQPDGDRLSDISEHAREMAQFGYAVLPPDDAREYWLQQARDDLRDIAKQIWATNGLKGRA